MSALCFDIHTHLHINSHSVDKRHLAPAPWSRGNSLKFVSAQVSAHTLTHTAQAPVLRELLT